MAIQLLIRDIYNDVVTPQVVSSSVALSGADEVKLAAGTPNILKVDKKGADLALRFEDEQEIEFKDFFVINEQGDFNQILTSDGKVIASALTAPEAASGDIGFGAEQSSVADAETQTVTSSGGWFDLESADSQGPATLLAGTGLAFGLGSMLQDSSDGGDDDADAAEEADAFLSEVDALLGHPAPESGVDDLINEGTTDFLEDPGHSDVHQKVDDLQTAAEFDDRTMFVADSGVMLSGPIGETDPLAPLFDEVEL